MENQSLVSDASSSSSLKGYKKKKKKKKKKKANYDIEEASTSAAIMIRNFGFSCYNDDEFLFDRVFLFLPLLGLWQWVLLFLHQLTVLLLASSDAANSNTADIADVLLNTTFMFSFLM
ncbi:uncharacterized protein LOC113333441 [Papaver somniferum]|uniref:uncharacterized protein LOC113333441 n=1 Tax=Papaver somniferum TaxID=3469 RepID=UPI000E705E2D|nr:uncharacterized protein LOC113333441 [Papaver somniferum]